MWIPYTLGALKVASWILVALLILSSVIKV